jgi:hypothetical protein
MTTAAALVPSDWSEQEQSNAGLGVSMAAADRSLPLFDIGQAGSPWTNKRDPSYIESAAPGCIRLRGAVQEIRDGTAGIVAQHCGMRSCFIEYLPNRGGYVERHDRLPDDAALIPGRRRLFARANGDVLEETREIYLWIENQPYLLPCFSTRHQFARQWNTYLLQFHTPDGGHHASYVRKYRITTFLRTGALGDWYSLKFVDGGWASASERATAAVFAKSVARGFARGNYDADVNADDMTD